jgi:hypothetical protein
MRKLILSCLATIALSTWGCEQKELVDVAIELDSTGCAYPVSYDGLASGVTTGTEWYKGDPICIYNADGVIKSADALRQERNVWDQNRGRTKPTVSPQK